MKIRILDGLDDSDLDAIPELREILARYNLKLLETNIEFAINAPEEDFPQLAYLALKKMYQEIGELARKRKVSFYEHGSKVLRNEYKNVFALPDSEEKIFNMIGYKIFFAKNEILLSRVKYVHGLFEAVLARQKAQAAEKI